MILLLMDATFAFLMICCAVSDKHTRVIPNSLISALMCLSLFHLIAVCAMGCSLFPYLMAIPLFFLCYMCWRRGMFGGGDVKLLTAICFYFGFWQTAIAFEASLFAMMVRYGLYRLKHKGQKYMRIALAPPLAMGCLITLAGQYIMVIF